MTLYINPLRRTSRRRAIEEMMRDWDEDYSSELSFPMDIIVKPDAFLIKALLPGVKPEDLDIQIVNETVTITGELKPDQVEDAKYLLAERPSGRFQRAITLPTQLDADNVEANLESGVLSLYIPKVEEAKPRLIKVKKK